MHTSVLKDRVICQDAVQGGGPSAENVRLPLTGQCAACSVVALSMFYTAVEGFRLKNANCSASLSVMNVLCLGILDFVAFIVFSRVCCVGKNFLLQ